MQVRIRPLRLHIQRLITLFEVLSIDQAFICKDSGYCWLTEIIQSNVLNHWCSQMVYSISGKGLL